MERLTERIGDCICLNYEKHPNDAINSAYKKLAAYEDTGLTPEQILAMDEEYTKLAKELGEYKRLEEQGLLIKLPCKVGDKIYKLWSCGKNGKTIAEFEIAHIDVDFLPKIEFSFFKRKGSGNYYFAKISDIGKTVFLTKAEAEKALEEMKGE